MKPLSSHRFYALYSSKSTILTGLSNHLRSSPISYNMVYLHTICVINSLFITRLMELLAHNGVHCLPFLYCAAVLSAILESFPLPSLCSKHAERERAGKEKGRTSSEKALHRNPVSSREAENLFVKSPRLDLFMTLVLVFCMHGQRWLSLIDY